MNTPTLRLVTDTDAPSATGYGPQMAIAALKANATGRHAGNPLIALGILSGLISDDVRAALAVFLRSTPPTDKDAADAAMAVRILGLATERGIDLDNPPCETTIEDCPLEDCHHPHDPDEQCTFAIVDESGNQRPCGCFPCWHCKGHRVVPTDNGRGERQCGACDGYGRR